MTHHGGAEDGELEGRAGTLKGLTPASRNITLSVSERQAGLQLAAAAAAAAVVVPDAESVGSAMLIMTLLHAIAWQS